jgi:hypothetical protein
MNKLLLLGAAALAGCAHTDLHVPSVRVLFTSTDTIKMEWRTLRAKDADVEAMARAYCGGRGAVAVDADQRPEFRSRTWRCS